jgi:hypothetical protein
MGMMINGAPVSPPDSPVIKEQLEVLKNDLEISKKTHHLSWAILIVSIFIFI